MQKKNVKQTVFVGMSGGVDSSVSAGLLKKQGYDVVGVFIRTWHPEFLKCNEEEERRDAMRVAAFLDIPFLTFDFEDVYKKEVADYMIHEYREGRTPNPDVMCNKEVKFGSFLKKALVMGADFVATGHYAQRGTPHFLIKGADPAKDQSYFLWTLKQEQLSKILFPIGHMKKTEVRKIAQKMHLPVAEKKDSQGICFLGDIDLKEFLKHYIKEKRGDVVNESGEVMGHHSGVVFNTLGERHGFVITKKTPEDKPYYVVGKDLEKNILVVSNNKSKMTEYSTTSDNFTIKNTNWIFQLPLENKKYTAQVRYHGEFLKCKVVVDELKSEAKVFFEKPMLIASGQSVVIYDKDIVLGGGVVV